MQEQKLITLRSRIEHLCRSNRKKLLFHGWHHIVFVTKKAVEIAEAIKADVFLVESAALTHDLNYLVKTYSAPVVGSEIRTKELRDAGYSPEEIERIEQIVIEADITTRTAVISEEGKALSDADTAFKALPITPVMFSSKYIQENRIDIYKLAQEIVSEQNKLIDQGIYFYTEYAHTRYFQWATVNLALWNSIKESLDDPAVRELIALAMDDGVL